MTLSSRIFLSVMTIFLSHSGSAQQPVNTIAAKKAIPIKENFATESELFNTEHLKEHFLNEIDTEEPMSERRQVFLYYQSFDLNKDRRLDGLEIGAATIHDHIENNDDEEEVINEADLEFRVDDYLLKMDKNNDGFVNFPEFFQYILSTTTHSSLKDVLQ